MSLRISPHRAPPTRPVCHRVQEVATTVAGDSSGAGCQAGIPINARRRLDHSRPRQRDDTTPGAPVPGVRQRCQSGARQAEDWRNSATVSQFVCSPAYSLHSGRRRVHEINLSCSTLIRQRDQLMMCHRSSGSIWPRRDSHNALTPARACNIFGVRHGRSWELRS